MYKMFLLNRKWNFKSKIYQFIVFWKYYKNERFLYEDNFFSSMICNPGYNPQIKSAINNLKPFLLNFLKIKKKLYGNLKWIEKEFTFLRSIIWSKLLDIKTIYKRYQVNRKTVKVKLRKFQHLKPKILITRFL